MMAGATARTALALRDRMLSLAGDSRRSAFPGRKRRRIALGVVPVVVACTVVLLLGVAYATSQPAGSLHQIPTAEPIMAVPPPGPAAPRSFTVVGSGDVLLHDALWAQARQDAAAAGRTGMDFSALFAGVRPVVAAADLAICHLETPLAEPDGPFRSWDGKGAALFNAPPQVATALADVGYDSCSTASNHSLDMGFDGVVRTIDTLHAAGIKHAGTARDIVEWATPTLLRAGDVTVAHLAYTSSLNGLQRPAGKPWVTNYPVDVYSILFDARLARLAGAEVVIVSIHAGSEYQHAATSTQISVAQQLLASPDIDLILGAHVHVVQPLEKIGDKWVAYGMGNQVAWQNQAQATRDGIMPRFTFSEVSPGTFRVTRAEVIPIHMWLDAAPARLYDIAAVLASADTSAAVRASCAASLRRTRSIIGARGAFDAGLVLLGADLA